MSGRVRVYIATSFDGFIAGPEDQLDWLPHPTEDMKLPPDVLGFDAFMAEIGAMVMGRRTFDAVSNMGAGWFYGDTPVLVPTSHPLHTAVPTVRRVTGNIDAVLDEALHLAAGKDVYVDGGQTIRSALDAGRVDDLVITVVPVLLGQGLPLFTGLRSRHRLEIRSHRDYGAGMVQIHAVPLRD